MPAAVAKEVLQIAPGQLFPQLFDIHTPYLGSFLIYTANCVLSCCRDLITHSLAYKGAVRAGGGAGGCSNLGTAAVPVSSARD